MGPLLPKRTFHRVASASGLSWAGVTMKAQGAQGRAALGARESGGDDRHSKAGPGHCAALRV
eukprot:11677639-Alexandrium_andersonii.AAC.1